MVNHGGSEGIVANLQCLMCSLLFYIFSSDPAEQAAITALLMDSHFKIIVSYVFTMSKHVHKIT